MPEKDSSTDTDTDTDTDIFAYTFACVVAVTCKSSGFELEIGPSSNSRLPKWGRSPFMDGGDSNKFDLQDHVLLLDGKDRPPSGPKAGAKLKKAPISAELVEAPLKCKLSTELYSYITQLAPSPLANGQPAWFKMKKAPKDADEPWEVQEISVTRDRSDIR